MQAEFQVVDLFAGPGGLAEGFSAFSTDAARPFKIALSVEKESSAFATLRLRSFVRQFETIPDAYYEYVAGRLTKDALTTLFPEQWRGACHETLQAELGAKEAATEINRRIGEIKKVAGDRTVLVGGPPCQAYSLVGRARNRGVAGYVPGKDQRHFLYREYIRILDRLNPAAFVMENVKGMLSSTVQGRGMFTQIIEDLRNAGGIADRYTIMSLTPDARATNFVLRAEDHGIPQTRHRVILVGLRTDLATGLDLNLSLVPRNYVPTVSDAIRGLPALRSGLSKTADSDGAWLNAVREVYEAAAQTCGAADLIEVSKRLHSLARSSRKLGRASEDPPHRLHNDELSKWLFDERLSVVPNHCSRGHMVADLARYAFASVFADVKQRSPQAVDFPVELAPNHKNWKSKKFTDRFRVQMWDKPASTITSHIAKDGHYFVHPDSAQCRSLTVREAARLQTFPDNYYFEGNRTQQFTQVGNAVPPLLAREIAQAVHCALVLMQSDRKDATSLAA